MSLVVFWKYCLSGLSVGSIYAIVAIGFNIIYNTTGIINFAQGEFLILGAITAISFSSFLPLPLAICAAVVLVTLVGGLIELVFIRSLKDASVLRLIIVTIGLSILLREGIVHVWDEKVRALPFFSGTGITSISILGARISPQYLWVLGVSAVTVAGLTFFFRFTLIGKAMRACSANRNAARLCGVNAARMVTFSFMLSAGIGALAGCVISPITHTRYDMGPALAVKGFTVAVLGGLGNSLAACGAGLILGVIESLSVHFFPSTYMNAVSVLILLAILFIKPAGIFGSKEAGGLKKF